MTLAIIGAGQVGLALGRAFTREGRAVTFGVSAPDKYEGAVAALGGLARVLGTAQAIAEADIVILAVPHAALPDLARSVPHWQGKVLVDATNPLAPRLDGLLLGTDTSGAEQLAGWAHGAKVVKAFNTTGAENMADARYAGGRPCMPLAGDDAQARQQVADLAQSIGLEPLDMGPLRAARYIEPMAMAWIHLALKQGLGRDIAFGMLRR